MKSPANGVYPTAVFHRSVVNQLSGPSPKTGDIIVGNGETGSGAASALAGAGPSLRQK